MPETRIIVVQISATWPPNNDDTLAGDADDSWMFQMALGATHTWIQITYLQQLSALERDHGSFKKGRYVHRLQYELWPLKGWKLNPKFRLHLEVKLRRDAPSWWKRTFGTVTSMACGKQGKGQPVTVRPKQQGAYLVLAARMGKQFPDRLTCRFGDKDLL